MLGPLGRLVEGSGSAGLGRAAEARRPRRSHAAISICWGGHGD